MTPTADVLDVNRETRGDGTLFAWTAVWVTVACPRCGGQHVCCLIDRSESTAWCPRAGTLYRVTTLTDATLSGRRDVERERRTDDPGDRP